MNKFKTVKEVLNTVVGKIVTVIISIALITSIIPGLLNARNDFAVLVGLGMVLTIIICIIMYFQKILAWLGFDTTH